MIVTKAYQYFEFEVSLLWIEPRVWRRFMLPLDATFNDLHQAIQDAGPWEDQHMHAFHATLKDRHEIGEPEPRGVMFFLERPKAVKKNIRLADYFLKDRKKKCYYEYDFGDSWRHEVKFVGRIKELPEKFLRRLTGGERSFPMEDCGGVPGYYACLDARKILADPNAPMEPEDRDYASEFLEWVEEWDPEGFDLEKAKKRFDR